MDGRRRAPEDATTTTDAWRSRLRSGLGAVQTAGILSLLVVIPFFHGGSGFLTQGLIGGAIFALVALGCVRWALFHRALLSERYRHYHGRFSVVSLLGAAGLTMGYGLLQTLPLPTSVIQGLSPQALAVRQASLGSLISGSASPWFPLSLSSAATREALVVLAASWGFFFLYLTHSTSWKNLRRVALLLTVTAFIISLWGMMKVGDAGRAVPGDASNPDAVPFATFINHSHFANWAGMVALMGIGYFFSLSYREASAPAIHPGSRRAPGGWDGGAILPRRLLLGFMAAMIIGAVFLSMSKGGAIAMGGGLLAFCALLASHGAFGKGWRIAAMILVVVMIAAVLGGGPLLEQGAALVRARAWGSLESGREVLNRDLLAMIGDYKIVGSGPGTFADLYPRYQTADPTNRYSYAHNDYLQLLAEWGMAGALLFLIFMAVYLRKFFHRWKLRRNREVLSLAAGAVGGMAVMLVHALVDFSFRIPANALTFMFLAAFALQTVEARAGGAIADDRSDGYNGPRNEANSLPEN